MTTTKRAYSDEQVLKLRQLYLEEQLSLEEIAEELDKSVPSIRSKLVKEGIYQKSDKKSTRKSGPSIKELVRDIENITGLHFEGLMRANKQDLVKLDSWIRDHLEE